MMNLHEACVRKGTTPYQLAYDSGVSYPRLLMAEAGTIRLLKAEEEEIENMLDAVKEVDWEEMFGKRQIYSLQVARLARGVTQQVLAENSKVSQPRISMHESEALRLNVEEKERIEQALNTTIKWEENKMETNEMPGMNFNKAASTADMKAYLEEKYGVAKATLLISSMTDAELKEFTKDMEVKDNKRNNMPKMHITNAVRQ